MNFRSILKAVRLSFREHRGVQSATLAVLAATFTVVISFLSFSFNLRNVLQTWGNSVQITAYLKDEVPEGEVATVGDAIKALSEFKDVSFISKETAKTRFTQQMSTYAAGLSNDAGMGNPFPASFELTFNEQTDVNRIAALADQIQKIAGVEEVSYGQDWIQNYASLVDTFKWSSWSVAIILVLGSLLVVSNSIRASLERRRDEIDIMKLVGASDSMIRVPFVVEGAIMGLVAVSIGLLLSYAFFLWQVELAEQSLAFTGLATQLRFLNWPLITLILISGSILGALGSYSCVVRIKSLVSTDA